MKNMNANKAVVWNAEPLRSQHPTPRRSAKKLMKVAHRQAKQSDYAWLYNLKVASMRDYVDAVYGWDETIQKDFFDKDFRPDKITIITADGSDAGMFEIDSDEDGYFLKRIEIHPTFQRCGIGSQVIGDILRMASVERKHVRLMVFRVNPARALYERLGFHIAQETETHYKMIWRIPLGSPKASG